MHRRRGAGGGRRGARGRHPHPRPAREGVRGRVRRVHRRAARDRDRDLHGRAAPRLPGDRPGPGRRGARARADARGDGARRRGLRRQARVRATPSPRTGNVDLDQLEGLDRPPRTRAISVVHYLGLPVDMDRVLAIARAHDLLRGRGLRDRARRQRSTATHVGLLGDVGCFSFYPVKHITTGEGGMVITTRDDVAERVVEAARLRDRQERARRPPPHAAPTTIELPRPQLPARRDRRRDRASSR